MAIGSSIAFAALVWLTIVNTPGWAAVQQSFFDPQIALASLPRIWEGFLLNLLGGLALAALGIWGFLRESGIQSALPALLIPFGLWRSWRGLELLIKLRQP